MNTHFTIMKKELVFLLHGLFMNSFIMTRFARHLRKEGYIVSVIDYNSINIDTQLIFDTINKEIAINTPSKVHFIGHSLGGLMIREYLSKNELSIPGRVVTLGTPHNTASIASKLKDLKLDFVLGNSKNHGLIKPLDHDEWAFNQELGTISGTKPIGARQIFFPFEKQISTDGTVTLEESKIDGASDDIEVDINHTALVYSRDVMNHAITFLKDGKF